MLLINEGMNGDIESVSDGYFSFNLFILYIFFQTPGTLYEYKKNLYSKSIVITKRHSADNPE